METPPLLPPGYNFVFGGQLAPTEIQELRKAVGWHEDSVERWQICLDRSLLVVGVRDKGDRLVGMARITGDVRHAVLCDLAVHPGHQGRGIGRALVALRLLRAQELNVQYMYTVLAEDNRLRTMYAEYGFRSSGNNLFYDARLAGEG